MARPEYVDLRKFDPEAGAICVGDIWRWTQAPQRRGDLIISNVIVTHIWVRHCADPILIYTSAAGRDPVEIEKLLAKATLS